MGFEVGWPVGMDGWHVGCPVGEVLGVLEGCPDGAMVGTPLGCPVGFMVELHAEYPTPEMSLPVQDTHAVEAVTAVNVFAAQAVHAWLPKIAL